jgi:predicted restriction endonuclease
VKALKQLCNFECQFPNCRTKIRKRNGDYYIEVAHIHPVANGGRSVIGNLLVLCPNHHKEFDHGSLEISEQTENKIRGIINGKEFDIEFPD